jgi:hypothetical protein
MCVQLMVVNSTAFAADVPSCSLDGDVNLYTAVETFFFFVNTFFFNFCVMKQIHRPLLLLMYTGVLAHSTLTVLFTDLLVSC